jgi:hypothetical protein
MINPFIYAEEACGFDRIEDLEEARPSQYFTREPTRFSVEPVTRNASIMSIQERLVGGLRKTAAQRYLDFRRLYPASTRESRNTTSPGTWESHRSF